MERTRSRSSRRRRGGFTLLELLIVLAILGVIAAMVAPSLLGTQQKAMIKAAGLNITEIESAAKRYAVEHDGIYPSSQEGLAALVSSTGADGKVVSYLEKMPVDPWGQQYFYEYNPEGGGKQKIDKPAIWSSGPNRKNDNGSGDDIKNWDN